jgi:hypothetical protein
MPGSRACPRQIDEPWCGTRQPNNPHRTSIIRARVQAQPTHNQHPPVDTAPLLQECRSVRGNRLLRAQPLTTRHRVLRCARALPIVARPMRSSEVGRSVGTATAPGHDVVHAVGARPAADPADPLVADEDAGTTLPPRTRGALRGKRRGHRRHGRRAVVAVATRSPQRGSTGIRVDRSWSACQTFTTALGAGVRCVVPPCSIRSSAFGSSVLTR